MQIIYKLGSEFLITHTTFLYLYLCQINLAMEVIYKRRKEFLSLKNYIFFPNSQIFLLQRPWALIPQNRDP